MVITLASFSGGSFSALIEIEHDGTLSIVTEDRAGYGSAHIGYAHEHFGGPALRELEHRYTTQTGALRVLTCWKPVT